MGAGPLASGAASAGAVAEVSSTPPTAIVAARPRRARRLPALPGCSENLTVRYVTPPVTLEQTDRLAERAEGSKRCRSDG